MRDNGYKNTAYAVAELIDNAIQAGARHVQLLAGEELELVQKRHVPRIKEVGVLDDGSGMDAETLRMALQFGNGTRLDDRSGIGRFGMGLPSASISQARRVEVWSWTDSPDRANYTFIDLDEIEKGSSSTVPLPVVDPVPQGWRDLAESVGSSGTLVVWSKLDRMQWRRASTIIDRSEDIIGRMYRRYLHEGEVTIRLAEFDIGDRSQATKARPARVNDPLYLMAPSSTPAPYDNDPMFEPDGDEETWEIERKIEGPDGGMHTVTTRFTVAKSGARRPNNAGALPYGKHAGRNVGVSLMRAGRELDLDQSLVIGYDPRERWWGVEVDFPPALDEVFGVTNNKQSARYFSEVTASIDSIIKDDSRSTADIKGEMEENGDPAADLVEVAQDIQRRLSTIRKALKIQTQGQKSQERRYGVASPEAEATEITKKFQAEGRKGQSDKEESMPESERVNALAQVFEGDGLTQAQARNKSLDVVQEGMKYVFSQGTLDGGAFFNVRPVAGEIVIKINVDHPAYEGLVEVLENQISDGDSRDELAERLRRANRGLKLLLMAWARYEDEEALPARREALQDIRTDWGRVASRFLRG
ncbi:ATP-binding protein [Rhodococcus spongiicola]|uniref:ATP-binding protein n=2 Tax=Rhodococcus spongiicola TaxID=2487352 RepID=A0A3S3AE87_9NOCA|nr:ATP-binding protein [Rhodococcus spongiicola]